MPRLRPVRTFAAPLVVTVAAGCGHAEPPYDPGPMRCRAPTVIYQRVESTLPPGVGELRFHDPYCEWIDIHGEHHSDVCPEDLLPAPPADRLIVDGNEGDWVWCMVVPEGNRVRCPDGGPNVILPDPTTVGGGTMHYGLDTRTLRCEHEIYANPPYWEPSDDCPATLLPTLTNGATITEKKGKACFWNDVRVRCP